VATVPLLTGEDAGSGEPSGLGQAGVWEEVAELKLGWP
jgi:hypothetical protein